MARFRGLFEHSLDDKGRTAMPAPLRDVLARRSGDKTAPLILSTALEPCLRLYIEADWEKEEDRFELESEDDYFNLDREKADLRRLILGQLDNVSLDKHSRILIPPRHRQHAGLKEAVVWVGQGGYVELWDPDRWEEHIAQARANRENLLRRARERASSGTE